VSKDQFNKDHETLRSELIRAEREFGPEAGKVLCFVLLDVALHAGPKSVLESLRFVLNNERQNRVARPAAAVAGKKSTSR
jgi:hypothetical protein